MLGVTSQTQPTSVGGHRYSSFTPDLILTYSLTSQWNVYAEVYGQSKTSPTTKSGFNSDGGFLYLLYPNISLDIEYGQRISGDLYGLEHYVGAGISAMF